MSDLPVVATPVREILFRKELEGARIKREKELERIRIEREKELERIRIGRERELENLKDSFGFRFMQMARFCYPSLESDDFEVLTKDELLELDRLFMERIAQHRFWHRVGDFKETMWYYKECRAILVAKFGDDWFPKREVYSMLKQI